MTHRAALPPRHRIPLAGRIAAAIAVAIALVAGVLVFGRLADDERVAMGLTAAWFAGVLAGGYLVTRRRAELRAPLAGGYGAVAIAFALLVVLPSIRGNEVNERVVSGTPATDLRSDGQGSAPQTGNVQLASGSFRPIAHPGQGTAAVIELPSGERKLTLTDFETDAGPDLRVYVASGDPASGEELGDFVDLGGLKGNKGNQQYTVPADIDLARYPNVVIWCRAFSVGFTSAPLAAS